MCVAFRSCEKRKAARRAAPKRVWVCCGNGSGCGTRRGGAYKITPDDRASSLYKNQNIRVRFRGVCWGDIVKGDNIPCHVLIGYCTATYSYHNVIQKQVRFKNVGADKRSMHACAWAALKSSTRNERLSLFGELLV